MLATEPNAAKPPVLKSAEAEAAVQEGLKKCFGASSTPLTYAIFQELFPVDTCSRYAAPAAGKLCPLLYLQYFVSCFPLEAGRVPCRADNVLVRLQEIPSGSIYMISSKKRAKLSRVFFVVFFRGGGGGHF